MASTLIQAPKASVMLGGYPLCEPITPQDVNFAMRTVATHRAQQWPHGTVCRNDRAVYPCGLRLWAAGVLYASGMEHEGLVAILGPDGDA